MLELSKIACLCFQVVDSRQDFLTLYNRMVVHMPDLQKERRDSMYNQDDVWMMKKIFCLSDHALIRMVNRLFQTEYEVGESIQKEWREQESIGVILTVGCANRYEFRMRRLEGCIQIMVEDRGCLFYYEDATDRSEVRLQEPPLNYFGHNTKEKFCRILEFSGHEQIILSIYAITVCDQSAWKLEEAGLIVFLPFLFYCFGERKESGRQRRESLKIFVIRDIVGALYASRDRGDLTAFDVEKLKQCCRGMLWKLLAGEGWMQNLELQELMLRALEPDIGYLEHMHRKELKRIQDPCIKS